MSRILAVVFAVSGMGMMLAVFLPVLLYQFTSPPLSSYLSPVPAKPVDYTQASNWFPTAEAAGDFRGSGVNFYTISIPKLRIKNAAVAVGGEDLKDSLIQYPGTALPGKPGNPVIFGHSILPIFYNPQNYMSIFSTLPTLTQGDEITINYDGVVYRYKVEDKFEVLPSDLQVLEQNLSDSFLTLVTCTPPGDPFRPRRLIVRARIVPYENIGH
jgi:sortase A